MTLISGHCELSLISHRRIAGRDLNRRGERRRSTNLTHSHTWNFAHLYFLKVRERRGQVKKANFRRKSIVKTRRPVDRKGGSLLSSRYVTTSRRHKHTWNFAHPTLRVRAEQRVRPACSVQHFPISSVLLSDLPLTLDAATTGRTNKTERTLFVLVARVPNVPNEYERRYEILLHVSFKIKFSLILSGREKHLWFHS